ncbi:DsbA family protein [Pseudomonas monsensis]
MSMHSSTIQVTYDFICPWCWIGEENLERALAATGFSTSHSIRFLPYQLNPDMPVQGMDRKAYRSGKFGSWARSQALDAQVTHAGKAVGLEFDYERVEKNAQHSRRASLGMARATGGQGRVPAGQGHFQGVFRRRAGHRRPYGAG